MRDGVELVLGANVARVERRGAASVLQVAVAGASRELEVDEILLGIGRAPNVENIGLEAAGVGFDPERGVRVDDRLRTTNRRIFAAGDVCMSAKFTHAADAAAKLVVRNAFFFGRGRASLAARALVHLHRSRGRARRPVRARRRGARSRDRHRTSRRSARTTARAQRARSTAS